MGGRISAPTVRAQDRWPGTCRFHEVSPSPSVVVGARCAGGVAGGQPCALPGPLARREQRRARGGDGRRLALRQGSDGKRTPGAHRPPGSSQTPRPAGARSGRGCWRGRRGRAARAAGARVGTTIGSKGRQPGSLAQVAAQRLAAPRARARPPPSGGGSRRHRHPRVRRHLPRRHLFSSVDRCEQRSTSPPLSPRGGVLAPQPALPPPLTRATRSCRSLAAALRGLGVCSAAVRPARAGTRRAARLRRRPCPTCPPPPALNVLLARRPARHWRGLTNFTHSLGAGYPARSQKHTANSIAELVRWSRGRLGLVHVLIKSCVRCVLCV